MCNSGYFLSYVDGLGTSYVRSFLASTNARFYKELDREMLDKRRFKENFPQAVLFSIVTPDCGLIQTQQCWTILLATLNNVGSTTLFTAVFSNPEQVVRFLLCILGYHHTIMQWIWVGVNLGCIDVYAVLEWANDVKLHVFLPNTRSTYTMNI